MGLLQDKVAFITGAASGIGAGTAERFAAEGARVVLSDIQNEVGQQLCRTINDHAGQAWYVECDVRSPDSVEQAIAAAVAHFGRLDLVFANAGINGVFAPIEELQPDEWEHTFATNLKGTYLTIHFAVPHLKRAGGGSIIITSSVNGTRTFGNPGASAYSTSKAGQVAFMKTIALELGQHHIRCNAVCPGAIQTAISQRTKLRNTAAIGIAIELPRGSPAINKGKGQPGDVADVCLFLASDLSRHVSGVEIFVDGGASLLF